MITMKRNLTAILFLFISFAAFSKDIPKKIQDSAEVHFEEFELTLNHFDSLFSQWYINQHLAENKSFIDSISSLKEDPGLPADSLLADRLNQIETTIDFDLNSRTKAFINLYVVKRRQQLSLMLGLAEYYFPMFEEELDKQGLPLELKYLAVIESALNPNAISRVGATGLWQFMYATGKMYGLEVSTLVDQRRDPVKSTKAAVKYLKDLHNIYGDWLMVIAAYNCGPGNVNKAIRRSGYKKDFWSIYRWLPRETRGYVPAFIAANYAFDYHKEHNVDILKTPKLLTQQLDTLVINRELHYKTFSQLYGVDEKILISLNPQYKKRKIPAGNGKSYTFRVPWKSALNFASSSDSCYALQDSLFNEHEEVKEESAVAQQSNKPEGKLIYYTVKTGDNLGYIAEWYDCRAYDLRKWNYIAGNTIRVGQKLKVYVPDSKYSAYARVNDLSFSQKQAIENGASISQTSDNTEDGEFVYYKVKSGDTLWDISKKYPEASLSQIKRLNNIYDSRSLKPGQLIKINKKR